MIPSRNATAPSEEARRRRRIATSNVSASASASASTSTSAYASASSSASARESGTNATGVSATREKSAISCDVEEEKLQAVHKAVQWYRGQTDKPWSVTAVRTYSERVDGVALSLVLCCGDVCTMKKFSVRGRDVCEGFGGVSKTRVKQKTAPKDASAAAKNEKEVARSSKSSDAAGNAPQRSPAPAPAPARARAPAPAPAPAPTGPLMRTLRTVEDFQQVCAEKDSSVVVVDFTASWCGPCQQIAPLYQQLAEMYRGRAIFCKVDVDESRQLASMAGVRSMPTFKIYRNGREIQTIQGANGPALQEAIATTVRMSEQSQQRAAAASSSKAMPNPWA